MDSMYHVEIVEDDDEFDWDAAAREIDVACENNSNPSTSRPYESNYTPHFASHVNNSVVGNNNGGFFTDNTKKYANSKQATLDKFIARSGHVSGSGLRNQLDNRIVENGTELCAEGEVDAEVSCVSIDTEAAKTWIYPVNVPFRDYQFAITKSALFSNTLVVLPTGLGKTLIAAVVMYNYFRWFPEGKIVFAAPSRPLVLQQIEACHNVVGIRQEWTIDMTGQTSALKRATLWKSKRVFFVTPQVLERDIQSGTCPVKYLVCLVIDEAHRASGNYSYCVVVRELMGVPLRILALTATPGSKKQAIQNVIDNLHISNLEYRNESDNDVSPYVHNRNIELVQVPMGQNAVDINNLLLKVIHPYARKLQSAGLINNRDYQTLSPCSLLTSRDKFRQAPPSDLPHVKHGDIESCFAVLITLYHIRKLLSSHGIRPAYEMLEEKLQKGPFARVMSKNEDIWKAKLLMQQSLSHGAPSPKLSKLLDVLVDYFKTKDPNTSRVIIFSNFRGSVRDITNALSTIKDLVKATEFIGQSSGKTSKGQSQKVQQAVLEKFRTGGYNVIVATSIGEEGLDIMEVDLVVCFDANVSPLRMIQRMGRTGRKHDGRVVVLACEGSELNGYRRKQASCRTVRKHLLNGGTYSFEFHPSPRMIPHAFKPEVQLTELSIEQFVPRGKKLKNRHVEESLFKNELTTAEKGLLAKYFSSKKGSHLRLSLIAFPYFQTAPSKVNRVMHSHRTRMFIDAMQSLQELTACGHERSSLIQDEILISERHDADSDAAEPADTDMKDLTGEIQCTDIQGKNDDLDNQQRAMKDPEVFQVGTSTAKKHDVPATHLEKPPLHSFLFGSDFVSVDALGKVMITSVPALSSCLQHSAYTSAIDGVLENSSKQQSFVLKISTMTCDSLLTEAKAFGDSVACQTTYVEAVSKSSYKFNSQQRKSSNGTDQALENEASKKDFNKGVFCTEPIDAVEIGEVSSEDEFGELELSPRLTSFIQSGVVPESPINDGGNTEEMGREEELVPTFSAPGNFGNDLQRKSSTLEKFDNGVKHSNHPDACGKNDVNSSPSNKLETPKQKLSNAFSEKGHFSASPNPDQWQSPLADFTNSSSSKPRCLTSEGKPENLAQPRKLKRLRKVGDFLRKTPLANLTNQNAESKSQDVGQSHKLKRLRKVGDCSKDGDSKSRKENFDATSFSPPTRAFDNHTTGKNKRKGARAFIDEEAEVSSEAEMPSDEEDELGDDSYEDSFIDDRSIPTPSTQAESSKVDMMAIYRRSLLSQSPTGRRMPNFADTSPDFAGPVTRINKSGSPSYESVYSLHTPQTNSRGHFSGLNSVSSRTNGVKTSSEAGACATADMCRESETMDVESRKRKLSLCQPGNMPAINLEEEFALESGTSARGPRRRVDGGKDVCDDDDDDFFGTLDLDAIEAQAALLLRQKSKPPPMQKAGDTSCQPRLPNNRLEDPPSFDLGIL